MGLIFLPILGSGSAYWVRLGYRIAYSQYFIWNSLILKPWPWSQLQFSFFWDMNLGRCVGVAVAKCSWYLEAGGYNPGPDTSKKSMTLHCLKQKIFPAAVCLQWFNLQGVFEDQRKFLPGLEMHVIVHPRLVLKIQRFLRTAHTIKLLTAWSSMFRTPTTLDLLSSYWTFHNLFPMEESTLLLRLKRKKVVVSVSCFNL